MIVELSHAQVTALVLENLKKHGIKREPLRLTDDDVSDCRKRIIELIGLRRPKSIVHVSL